MIWIITLIFLIFLVGFFSYIGYNLAKLLGWLDVTREPIEYKTVRVNDGWIIKMKRSYEAVWYSIDVNGNRGEAKIYETKDDADNRIASFKQANREFENRMKENKNG